MFHSFLEEGKQMEPGEHVSEFGKVKNAFDAFQIAISKLILCKYHYNFITMCLFLFEKSVIWIICIVEKAKISIFMVSFFLVKAIIIIINNKRAWRGMRKNVALRLVERWCKKRIKCKKKKTTMVHGEGSFPNSSVRPFSTLRYSYQPRLNIWAKLT